jgi:16S rRNA processing protein RimM
VASRRRRSVQPALRSLADQPDLRWIALGVVTGTHGLRGGLKVKQHNPDSDLLLDLPEVGLRVGGELRVEAVVEVRATGKGLLVQLKDVRTIEQAAELRGAELCLPRQWLPPLAPGEFYHVDLEGLPVVTPDGRSVGRAERVQEYPAASVLRVRGAEGVWEVPLREPYLVEVDLEAGRVVVDSLADLDIERDRP